MSGSARAKWRWAHWLALAILLVLAAFVALFLRARAFDSVAPPPLASVTPVEVSLPDGRRATIGSLLHPGKPTVISLWASWCGPCRLEAPTIARLQARAARGDLNLFYLNVRDQEATRPDLNAALAEMGLRADSYSVLPDRAIARVTGGNVVAIPRTLAFDRDGQGVASITGYRPMALDRLEHLVMQ